MHIDAYDRLLPEVTDVNAGYWKGLEEHELRLQICDKDQTPRFPASPVCPVCLSSEAHWSAVSGNGTVWSWIVMHQKYFDAFENELPYTVVFVQLDEGPFMMSGVTVPEDQLSIGARVAVVFEKVGEHVVPKFRLAS
jgi:uncharacterized OB-fold protein